MTAPRTHGSPPAVVLTTVASVDGRITLSPHERLMVPTVRERWSAMWPPGLHLLAGGDRVDPHLGLARLSEVLGAERVQLDAGGTFNASMLRAGLVDEVDIVVLPGLVGGLGTPSFVDGPVLGRDEFPTRLELIDCYAADGVVRLRYRVLSDEPISAASDA